jgi:hypothetical protein
MGELRTISPLAWAAACAILALASGCGSEAEIAGEKEVGRQTEAGREDYHEKKQQAKRERMIKLAKTAPTYPRPDHDPTLVPSSYEGSIAVTNTLNGDILAIEPSSRANQKLTYAFRLKSGELVSYYFVEVAGGYPEEIDFIPFRIYGISHNKLASAASVAARNRMSPEIFARYLASRTEYARDKSKHFIVIDGTQVDENRK